MEFVTGSLIDCHCSPPSLLRQRTPLEGKERHVWLSARRVLLCLTPRQEASISTSPVGLSAGSRDWSSCGDGAGTASPGYPTRLDRPRRRARCGRSPDGAGCDTREQHTRYLGPLERSAVVREWSARDERRPSRRLPL